MYGVKFLSAVKRGICKHQDGNFRRSGRHGDGEKRAGKEEKIGDDEKEKKIVTSRRTYGTEFMKCHIS
jgi:hypothetical protein